MKLFVTGGAGFIGTNFINYILAETDYSVVNFDSLTYAGSSKNATRHDASDRYGFVKGDITHKDEVDSAIADCDVIVNFAAESHVDRSIENSYPFINSNILGTVTLLEVAKERGLHMHHVSTDEVFGSLGITDPSFTETTAYDPRSPYSASKASADHFVRAYYETHGVPISISHCSNNYGPYQHPEKFIPKSITRILQGEKITLYGSGKHIRDWIHVEDHVRGIVLQLEKRPVGETFCFGGQTELSNLAVAEAIYEAMEVDTSQIEYVEDRKGHDFRYSVDIGKAKSQLDWEPKVSFTEGLRATVEWYKANQAWWSELL